MFRALSFSEPDSARIEMDAPLSVSLLDSEKDKEHPRVKLALHPDDVFTTAVGHATKRTLAKWHVTSPAEVVEELLALSRLGEEPRL